LNEFRAKTHFLLLQCSSSEEGWRDKSAAGRRAVSTDPPFYNNEVKNKKPMTRRGRAEPDLFFFLPDLPRVPLTS